MPKLLMPKATATWLWENTSLTFEQIANFCHMHPLEIKAIADGEAYSSIRPMSPIDSNQLTREEITRCENDETAKLKLNMDREFLPETKKTKYTPLAKRQNKPNAIAWMIKHYPKLPDADICRLLGTTKKTIGSIRNKTHRYSKSIQAMNPVDLGMCSQSEFNELTQVNVNQD